MIEVKEFLNYLCGVFEYRFLTGIENKKLVPFYNNLDPKLLHYIPAISPRTAISMANGACIGGVKPVVILDEKAFDLIKCSFIMPMLIIIIKDNGYKPSDFKSYKIIKDFKSGIKKADLYIRDKEAPCLLLINKENLK